MTGPMGIPSERRGARGYGTTAAALAFLFAATTAQPVHSQDAEYNLTFAVLSSAGSYYGAQVVRVPEIIEAATDGRVSVDLNDSILGATQIASGVRAGRAEMSAAVQSYLTAEDPRMGLFNLPGLMQGMEEYRKVGEAFWFDDLAEIWAERYNAVVLANGAWCPNFLWSTEPIPTAEDFQGKTIRVHNPLMAAFVDALGGSPTAMAMTEVMPALERGVIDGVLTSWCVGWQQEYWRVADHVQNWGFADVTGWAIIMNQDQWNELPDDLQTAIRDAMAEYEDEVLSGYDEFAYGMVDEMMASDDITVIEVSDAERERIYAPEYIDGVYEIWYQSAEEAGLDGREYVQRVRDLLGR